MSAEAHQRLVTRLVEKIRRNADQIIRTTLLPGRCAHRRDRLRLRRSIGPPGGVRRSPERHPGSLLRLISLWPFPEQIVRELAGRADTSLSPK